jgi:hypothetical protein
MKTTLTAFVIAAAGFALFLSVQDCQAGNYVRSVQTNQPQPAKAVLVHPVTPAPQPPAQHLVSASTRWKKAHHCHYEQFCTPGLGALSLPCSQLEVCDK